MVVIVLDPLLGLLEFAVELARAAAPAYVSVGVRSKELGEDFSGGLTRRRWRFGGRLVGFRAAGRPALRRLATFAIKNRASPVSSLSLPRSRERGLVSVALRAPSVAEDCTLAFVTMWGALSNRSLIVRASPMVWVMGFAQ